MGTNPKFRVYNNKSNKKVKKRKISYLTFLIFLVVSVYMGVEFISFFATHKMPYVIAERGAMTNKISMEGIITRDEEVVTAQQEGFIEYFYPQGERLGYNKIVCSINDGEYNKILENKIQQVAQEIDTAKENLELKIDYQENYQELVQKSSQETDRLINEQNHDNFGYIYNYRDEMIRLSHQKNSLDQIVMNERIQNLSAEKNNYEVALQEYSKVVKQKSTGIIAYTYDQYMNQGFEDIEREQIKKLDKLMTEILISNDKKVKPDDILYRNIKSNIWHITCFVKEEEADLFPLGESVQVLLENDDQPVVATVIVHQKSEKLYKVVLELNTFMSRFMDYRKIEVGFKQSQKEGIKVPKSTLVKQALMKIPKEYVLPSQSRVGVMKLVGDSGQFVPIDIADEDQSNYFVNFNQEEGLRLNDIIVQNTEQQQKFYALTEVTELEGVYVINNGYREFKTIDIMGEEGDYVIVTGIKPYDRVLQDGKINERNS